jgi:hypothetical protein
MDLRKKHVGVLVVTALALAALGAGPATAATPKLDLTWSGEEDQLVPGETADMVLTTPATITSVTKKVSRTITCNEPYESGFEGVDLTNGEAADKIETSYGHGSLDYGEFCADTGSSGAYVNLLPLESILSLAGAKGKAELKPTPSGVLKISFETTSAACEFAAKKWKGTLKLEPYGPWHQVSLSFTNQKAKLSAAFGSCPKTVSFNATFGFANRSEDGFGLGYYIFGHLT